MSTIPWPLIISLAMFILILVVILFLSVGAYRKQLLQAPRRLGARMGLQRLCKAQKGAHGEFQGGEIRQRPFALTYVTLKTVSTDADGIAGANAHPTLRLFVEVNPRQPGTIDLHRRHVEHKPPTRFEEAFKSKCQGAEQLSNGAKEALWRFASQHGPMRLKDRQSYHKSLLPDSVLPHSPWVLVHDWMLSHKELKAGQNPDRVQAMLQKMSQIAKQLED